MRSITSEWRTDLSGGILDEFPNLVAYVARGEARPAYKRSFAAQLAVYNIGKPSARYDRELWIGMT